MAAAAAGITLDLKASRFTAQFNLYVNRAIVRWEPRASAILIAEGNRAARGYLDQGEAGALDGVLAPVWRTYLDRVWMSTVPKAGELVSVLLGKAAPDVFVDAAVRYLRQNAGQKVQNITNTSRDEIGNQIRIGVQKGETRTQIAQRITYHRRSITPGRAQTIARTEVHGAANYGSLIAAAEERVPMVKVWQAMGGARPTHAAASGQRRALTEPFNVGSALLDHPGAVGPPEETINCRCSMTYEAESAGRRRRRPAA